MRMRRKFLVWWHTPIARGWAMTSFLILAIGLALAVDGIHDQDVAGRKAGIEARTTIVNSGRAISVSGCNRDFRFGTTVRGVLQASRAQTQRALDRGDITPARAERAMKFYSDQLANLQLPDCRDALKILTDDPDQPLVIPKPLYPPEE